MWHLLNHPNIVRLYGTFEGKFLLIQNRNISSCLWNTAPKVISLKFYNQNNKKYFLSKKQSSLANKYSTVQNICTINLSSIGTLNFKMFSFAKTGSLKNMLLRYVTQDFVGKIVTMPTLFVEQQIIQHLKYIKRKVMEKRQMYGLSEYYYTPLSLVISHLKDQPWFKIYAKNVKKDMFLKNKK